MSQKELNQLPLFQDKTNFFKLQIALGNLFFLGIKITQYDL